jgi:RimJ/RimL family protein N-acetyltransferase
MRLQQSPLSVVPVLVSERLRLRAHTLSDLDAMAAMWADEGVTRHISGKPSTREESWGRMLRYVGHWTLMGFGYWLIEEKQTGRYVGDGGFIAGQRGVEGMIDAPEQGWAIAPSQQGKGYATEAANAMLAWADASLIPTVSCMIAPENAASIRVAEKAGYREYARAEYKGEPSILYRRDGA